MKLILPIDLTNKSDKPSNTKNLLPQPIKKVNLSLDKNLLLLLFQKMETLNQSYRTQKMLKTPKP